MDQSKFSYTIDSFNCIKFDLAIEKNYLHFIDKQEADIIDTVKKLCEELISKEVKGVWLHIPSLISNLIHYFVREGFSFHHTEEDVLVMTKWLPKSISRLPKYATHYFGVGGLIINQEGKLLLVKEKNTYAQLKGMWKIPTGLAEKGESIQKAVLREVKEETGLTVEYVGVYNFREAYPYLFGMNDIFFICVCTVDTSNQVVDIISGEELEEFKWFSVDELKSLLLGENSVSKGNQFFFKSILEILPDKIKKIAMKTSKDIKFLNSTFIFHNPNF